MVGIDTDPDRWCGPTLETPVQNNCHRRHEIRLGHESLPANILEHHLTDLRVVVVKEHRLQTQDRVT